MSGRTCGAITAALAAAVLAAPSPAAAGAEEALRQTWLGRHVVLRTAVRSDCGPRYTDNRLRGRQTASNGRHRFAAGEVGRVDSLHLQRARIDLLLTLVEPLRVELHDGPFQLYEHLECRVELEIPAPRQAVRQAAVSRLDELMAAVVAAAGERGEAEASPLWNRRRVEPLPDDHEERLAAYRAWKEEQLYVALRGRLAEALDRAADIAAGVDRGAAYARGLAAGVRDQDVDRLYSTDCLELTDARASGGWGKPPEELDGDEARDWKDGYEDGRRLRYEIALARRLERCLP